MYILYYETNYMENPEAFPSPLEVNRFISRAHKTNENFRFPSPREVDRFISDRHDPLYGDKIRGFPSPLEVDRFISQ